MSVRYKKSIQKVVGVECFFVHLQVKIKQIQKNTHSHDDCKFNRNFLYSRRILQIFCS